VGLHRSSATLKWRGLVSWAVILAGAAAAAACTAAAAAQATDPSGTSAAGKSPPPLTDVYTHLSIIDGGTIHRDMAIVVADEHITQIAKTDDIKAIASSAAHVIDGKGAYVIPGLIDTHAHLATSPNRRHAEALMRRYVYSGITAARDMAGDTRALGDLSRSALMKEIPGPDLYYAALMAGPEFFHDPRTISSAQGAIPGQVPWMQAITPSTDMPIAVAYARGTWATGIKIYADLPRDLVIKITAEAHRQGIKVWSHATVFPAAPRDMLDAKVDVISHVCMLAYDESAVVPSAYHNRTEPDYSKIDPEGPHMRALFDRMVRQGTILDATLRIWAEQEKRQGSENPVRLGCTLDFAARLTHQAYKQGVLISTGTDGWTAREAAYPALNEELELLQHRAGLPPEQVIRSATLVGAMTIGREGEMGSLQPGKLASFVLLTGNPLSDVANLRSVVMTVKRGTRYVRTDYRPIAADELGAGGDP
jgi:imidazolonepropionase-like amidohydrolase